MLSHKAFRLDTVSTYASTGAVLSANLLVMYLITAYGDLKTFGTVSVIISSAGIFCNVFSVRSNEAIVRFYVGQRVGQRRSDVKTILLLGFSLEASLAILLLVCLLLLAPPLARTFVKDAALANMFRLYAVVAFLTFVRGGWLGYLQANEKFVLMAKLRVIEPSLRVLLILALILAGNQITVRNVIVSYVVAAIAHNCILFTISFYFVRRNEPGMLSFPINWGLARDYLRFTWRTFTSSLLKAGNQNVENLIIAYFTSTEMAGMYKILHNILTPVRFISAPLSQLAYPKLVRLYEQQQFKQITAYLISTNKVILCVALPYVAAAVLLLHPVLQLLNSDYVLPNMRVSFAMLGVAFVVQAMFGWWVRAYSNAKNPNYSITMGVFQSLYIILIGALCTWRWGVHGFCGSYLAMVVMASAYWMRKLRAIEDGDTLLVGDQTSVQDRPSVAPQTTLQRTCPLG